jgi:predicted metalloprotease
MKWTGGRRSGNVVDARGRGMGLPVAGGGIGMAVLALVVYLLGGDPSVVTDNVPRQQAPPAAGGPARPGTPDQASDFVSVVLADTEDTWNPIFRERFGRDYPEPELVLFTDAVQSACGFAQAAMGPFYCPRDRRVYIDLAFYRELRERFRAPGDFAQAYVIAHEVGHHVQTVTGLSGKVAAARERAGRSQGNALSVRQELQADCYAGLWAHHAQRARDVVEPGDIEEALGAAAAIGDDRLQKASTGRVVPESFTHGTSEQRMTWFRRGYEQGTMEACDTFGQ